MISRKTHLQEKFNESLSAVLPVTGIVLLLALTIVPVPSGVLLGFIVGAIFVILGMMLFSLGAEVAMQPMGQHLGSGLTKTKNLPLILFSGFLLGILITMSEPDLQVLANQVQNVPNMVLILAVSIGVGIFLVVALLRVLIGVSLKRILIVSYIIVFVLSIFTPKAFYAVAFDSGGVTTGPMTVPFIMAFGVGISSIRNDKHAEVDSFGMVALCSVGPIIAVLVLSLIYGVDLGDADYSYLFKIGAEYSTDISVEYLKALPEYMKEIAISLLPIVLFFGIFQIILLKIRKQSLKKIAIGIIYTYVGLVLFLTGANAGFMPAGSYLGLSLAKLEFKWIIVPIAALISYFIIGAEPAVYVLMTQVEEITDSAIKGKTLKTSLSIGICVATALSMIRVLTRINIMWILIPGYALALLLTFFSPKVFTAIAFDSGGVASGPMTATFLLPFAIGAAIATGGDVFSDAFGVVALVALAPLLTIQILGIVYKHNEKRVAEKSKDQKTNEVEKKKYYEIIEL